MTPGVHQLRERADTMLTRLRLLDRYDKAYTRRRNAWTLAAIGAGIAGIFATVVASETRAAPPEAVFFLIGVPLVAVCVIQAVRYHRLDLDDRKIDLVFRLVTMLRADVRAREPIALAADFRSYRRGGTIVDRSGSFLGSNVKKYRHPWLTLRVTLADGNLLVVTVVDRITQRQKRKSAGGKTKYKRRVRGRSDVSIAMRLAKRYRPAADVVGRLGALSVPGLTLTVATPSTDGARLDATFRSPTVLDVAALPGAAQVLGALRWLYGGLTRGVTRSA